MSVAVLAFFVLPFAAGESAVLAVGDRQVPVSSFAAARAVVAEEAAGLLSEEDAAVRLFGHSEPRDPSPEALGQVLAEAQARAAAFDLEGAVDMFDQVVRAFDGSMAPNDSLRRLAASSLHEKAVAYLHAREAKPKAAFGIALEASQRFASVPLNPARYPPTVGKLFQAAAKQVQEMPVGTLEISSDVDGELWLDGRSLGRFSASRSPESYSAPEGTYRLWLVSASGVSLPQPVSVRAGKAAQVAFDLALDRAIVVERPLRLRCQKDCATRLAALGRRLSLAKVIGVRQEKPAGLLTLIEVNVTTGASDEKGLDLRVPFEQPGSQAFSPLLLLPFGGGQWIQKRYSAAASYLAVQLGLLAWHIVATVEHEQVRRGLFYEPEQERRARAQRNLSAGFAYGFAVVSVIESLVVHTYFRD